MPKGKKGPGIGEDLELQRDILYADMIKRILNVITQERGTAKTSAAALFTYNARQLESYKFLEFLGKRPEDSLTEASANLTGDLPAVLNYVQKENELEYQFVRPSPRLGTTIKRFIRTKHAYRVLVPVHFHTWSTFIQEIFGKVIKDISAAPTSSGMKTEELQDSLMSLMRDAEQKARAQLAARENGGSA